MAKTGITEAVGAKAHLAAALPYIEAELQKQQAVIIARAGQLYQAHQMSDAVAKELWIELFSVMGLSKRLNTSIRMDAARAETLLNPKAE